MQDVSVPSAREPVGMMEAYRALEANFRTQDQPPRITDRANSAFPKVKSLDRNIVTGRSRWRDKLLERNLVFG